MTRRRASYRSLSSLQRDNRVCRACVEADHQIESKPVFGGREVQRAYLFGLAPGIVEGEENRPWRGRAGKALRRWLEMDEERFYETFYLAAVTRCYPGKPASGRGDRTTTPEERRLCAFWQEWEMRLLRPRLLVPVGGVAIKRLLGLDSLACVGTRIELEGAVAAPVTAIPLPHPSGASGWLNDAGNRVRLEQALRLLRHELDSSDLGPPT
ncbi:MAG: uracil-DNA glycosylase family protein [Gaiellaceae bacterium]